MKRLCKLIVIVPLATVGLVAGVPASAASHTLNGTAFDITFDDAVIGLFGLPTLLGNSLFFAPGGSPGFSAQSDDGIDVANSTFAFTISANPGFTLDSFRLSEEGDYFFFGPVAGVAASGQLRVKPLVPNATTLTSPISGASFSPNALLDFGTHDWQAGTTISTTPLTLAQVSIQNLLAAYANGDLAFSFIEKKNVTLEVGVSPVPEPAGYAMFLAGLGMIAFAARRRIAQESLG